MADQPNQPSSAAARQRDYNERQRGAGYKLTAVWIQEETAKDGIRAARKGDPLAPMDSLYPLSWAAGWISEKGKQ
ncbi:hypothetical protein RA274_28600, partial [Pseudomonas syringae pv. tagetis]|uniref:hypothetical protein n=1 Tax=Pseudomonas syringae group genomosp. 7 TaxID=251699 RepID=UPI00376F65A1